MVAGAPGQPPEHEDGSTACQRLPLRVQWCRRASLVQHDVLRPRLGSLELIAPGVEQATPTQELDIDVLESSEQFEFGIARSGPARVVGNRPAKGSLRDQDRSFGCHPPRFAEGSRGDGTCGQLAPRDRKLAWCDGLAVGVAHEALLFATSVTLQWR